MFLWWLISGIIVEFVWLVIRKVAPVLWQWLYPAGCRMWSAFAPRAERWAGKVKTHFHANRPLWGVTVGYLLWWISWSVAKGPDSAVLDLTYSITVLCTWTLCAFVAIRWLVIRLKGGG